MTKAKKGFLERLADGEILVYASGYCIELERRGYLSAGSFIPEVVLEHPDVVAQLHREWVHAGSDIVVACTYFGLKEKLDLVGRGCDAESLNRCALKMAREVADETGTLMAGGLGNTTIYDHDPVKNRDRAAQIFKEQVQWAVEGGADLLIGETFASLGEALLAIDAIKKYGNGLPSVVMLAPNRTRKTFDDFTYPDALKQIKAAGADVVGINCNFGPNTIIPEIEKVRKVVEGPLACVPLPVKTTPDLPSSQDLRMKLYDKSEYHRLYDAIACPQRDFVEFGRACKEIGGIQFVGICCGNSARYTRALAEAIGKTPPASRYKFNIKLHYALGDTCPPLSEAAKSILY